MYLETNLKQSLLRALLLACYFWLTCCNCSSEYELIVSGRDSNLLTLICRCRSDLQDNPTFPIWLNDTQQTIKERLGVGSYIQSQTGLQFHITRDLEGNYFCGPNSSIISPQVPIVAYPLPGGSIPTPRISVVAGRDAVLPPLISPGALILQYFIDWQDATSSATLARIQVPRSEVPAKSERYSIDPDTFELTIHSVRFEDRGSYRGVIGVRDPEGQSFTYTQTQERGVTLEVFVPPTFLEYPPEKLVVNRSSFIFSCKVQGYPQPTIVWKHNGQNVTTTYKPHKYRIEQTVSTGPPFIVESNLTITTLRSEDSGEVTCVAEVTTNEGETLEDQRTSHLSFLGSLAEVRTYITLSKAFILKARLVEPLGAEVQLFVQYTNTESGVSKNLTTVSYVKSKEIVFFDENTPYRMFTVEVSLMSGSLMGPLYQDNTMHDRDQPTDIFLLVTDYILPTCGGLLGGIIVAIIIITCLCRKACLQCCTKINRQGTVIIAVDKRVDLHLPNRLGPERGGENDVQGGPERGGENDVQGGPPPGPAPRQAWHTNLWQLGKKIISYLQCNETEEEREAVERFVKMRRLLNEQ